MGKKSSPNPRAISSILCCSARRYWGSAVLRANSVTSLALSEKLFDRADDGVLVPNLARHQAILFRKQLPQILDELARAIGTFHLAVAEHVDLRQKLLLQ